MDNERLKRDAEQWEHMAKVHLVALRKACEWLADSTGRDYDDLATMFIVMANYEVKETEEKIAAITAIEE